MTIIVAYRGIMAADSMSVCGGRRAPAGYPKIKCLPDGSLVGCTGSADDCYAFADWAARGFPDDSKPTLTQPDDGFRAIHMRLDGSIWGHYSVHRAYPMVEPGLAGESIAVAVADGAIAAGKSAQEAVRIAIERTVWVGGPVQVEYLGGVKLAAVAG